MNSSPKARRTSASFFRAGCTTPRCGRWSFWGCRDAFGDSEIPLYVLNVTYPLIDEEVKDFCAGKRAVLMIEEGQPDFIEQNLHAISAQGRCARHEIHGKDMLRDGGRIHRRRRYPKAF